MYTSNVKDFYHKGRKCIMQLYHCMFKHSLWSVIKQIIKLALDCTKHQNDLQDKIGNIRKLQHRFVEEFNGRKQESVPQKATKHRHALLHVV
jgi:hypothetical protein